MMIRPSSISFFDSNLLKKHTENEAIFKQKSSNLPASSPVTAPDCGSISEATTNVTLQSNASEPHFEINTQNLSLTTPITSIEMSK